MTPSFDEPPGLVALAGLVRDCSVSGVPRRALLLRTDLLPDRLSRQHHLRLAAEAIEPLMASDRARRYELASGRIAISWRGEAPRPLGLALSALELLLQDAPLDAPPMPELARLFDLPRDGAALMALAASPSKAQQAETEATHLLHPPRPPSPRSPLDLAALESMELQLVNASVARFTRRRSVCRIGATSFVPAWESRHLNVDELMADLAPGRNPYADPWLFRRLTRTFDRRLLSLLSNPGELRGAGPFSLHLNVGGVLSPEFLRFDAALPSNLRGHTILGLDPADVMRDLPAYRFAQAFAQARGYRILLRGLTPLLLAVLDLRGLHLDFVELRWSRSLAGLEPAALRAGRGRWLLCRADTDEAVTWGLKTGIGLFQGDAVHPNGALPERQQAA